MAPSPLHTLLENVSGLSEALWNKPVDCVLLGVSGAWWFITSLGCAVPLCVPYILADIVFEIDKGTRVLTHSPNAIHKRRAANIVAIDRYQCARVLQARLVSVISTDDSDLLLLAAFSAWQSLFKSSS